MWGRGLRAEGPYPLPHTPSPNPVYVGATRWVAPEIRLVAQASRLCFMKGSRRLQPALALDILNQRYAKREITQDEFEPMKRIFLVKAGSEKKNRCKHDGRQSFNYRPGRNGRDERI
jgi:hypothetical protein